MKRTIIFLSCLVFLMVSITACSGTAANPKDNTSDPTGIKEESTGTQQDTEIKPSSGNRSLVVYSPQGGDDRGAWLVERAKKDIDVDIQFLTATGGELSARILAEKENPQADIVLGLVPTVMYQLKAENIFIPYTPQWADGLPDVYKDKDGAFYSFWQTPIVMAYNPEFLTDEQAPQSWLDLAKPEVRGLYNIDSTGAQTVRSYIIGILWNFYDPEEGDVSQEGWDYLSAVFENSREEPIANDSDKWALMSNGDAPLVLSWYGGIKANTAEYNIPVEYVKPTEGTPVVAEAIGIINGTDKEELAQEFVDWFGSAQVMADYAAEFGQAPAHPDAIALCPEEVQNDATMFVAQDIDWEIVSTKLDDWLEKIELEIMQ